MRVTVVGGSVIPPAVEDTAETLGREPARRDHTVVCGGLGGTMAAVCRGARELGGHTIGILPTDRPSDANPYVVDPIATGLGHARNALVVMNGSAVIALPVGGGTLSEIGLGLAYGRPVAGLDTHDVDGVEPVDSPEEAVDYVEDALGRE